MASRPADSTNYAGGAVVVATVEHTLPLPATTAANDIKGGWSAEARVLRLRLPGTVEHNRYVVCSG
eukprot:1606338-Pyramimonas_sp.AAC.1